MREVFPLANVDFLTIIIPAAIIVAAIISGYIIREVLFSRLAKWSTKSKTHVDDIIVSSIKSPFITWFVILGLYMAAGYSKIPASVVHIINKTLAILIIFSFTQVIANIASGSIKLYSPKIKSAFPVTSLTQNLSRIVIYGVGILTILSSLGISITPILATLGVGGLAVALALQDTLSNLFSGFYIIISGQIRPGDYVKLDSGEEGYITDITWRTTKIKMLPNNVILVPNEKLTKATVTNYHMPDKEMSVLVNLGVHYKSDLDRVEKITCDVAKQTMKEVPGGISEFEPFIRYGSLGDFSVNFTVILRAREFADQYLIKHEFIKRLHERYKKEGVVIPYPTRTIHSERKAEE